MFDHTAPLAARSRSAPHRAYDVRMEGIDGVAAMESLRASGRDDDGPPVAAPIHDPGRWLHALLPGAGAFARESVDLEPWLRVRSPADASLPAPARGLASAI